MRTRVQNLECVFFVLALVIASHGAFGSGKQDFPPISTVTVATSIAIGDRPFAFVAREFEVGQKMIPDDAMPKNLFPLINLDLYALESGIKVPFDIKLLRRGNPDAQVTIIIPAALVEKKSKKNFSEVHNLYFLDGKKWVPMGEFLSKGISAHGKNAVFFWFQVDSWPIDDRFIACD